MPKTFILFRFRGREVRAGRDSRADSPFAFLMRQQQVKANTDKQSVNQQSPLPAAFKLTLHFRRVRQGFRPLLKVGDADRAEHKAERDQHAADDLERVHNVSLAIVRELDRRV